MKPIDAARLDLIRAVEAFMRESLDPALRVVKDVVVVARHVDARGENARRAVMGTTGFLDVPLDRAVDMLEDGFNQVWDARS